MGQQEDNKVQRHGKGEAVLQADPGSVRRNVSKEERSQEMTAGNKVNEVFYLHAWKEVLP